MKIGIEIEFYSPKTISATAAHLRSKIKELKIDTFVSYSNAWKITTDGSLLDVTGFYGMELVSPILDTDKPEDLRMVRKVCEVLQAMGSTVNSSCGLHVHVDGTELSVEEIKTIFHRYTKFERVIDLMVPSNRRGDNVYYTKGGTNVAQIVDGCQTKEALMRAMTNRYYKVNLCALQRHGTIEFRQHSGSINPTTILNWVEFITSFVKASAKIPSTTPVVRRRGRQPSTTGMTSGCKKVYDVFMASYNNGGGNLVLATIVNRTGLASNSIKTAISLLKTKHDIIIKQTYGQRGNTNPMYFIANPGQTPRLIPATSNASTPAANVDTVWRGIDKALKAYYVERMQELSGFANTIPA